MGRIPQQIIDQVRDSTDIVSLVASYVPLKRSGRNLKGLCPFHQEKTPSFTVSPEKQIFFCFGCQKGGNAISFLMEIDGVSFPEAVRHLARASGIEVPDTRSAPSEEGSHDLHYQLLEFAARFYRGTLAGEAGKGPREYLRNRGLTSETLESFQVGLASTGWENLRKAARAEGFLDKTLRATGLTQARSGAAEGYYDTFRERIMFPIFNLSRRVVGFGGRRLANADDESPKYVNSSDSPVFRKGNLLYGLHRTRDSVRKESRLILVEGYMDFLALYQAGIENVAATCGTAFTPAQARVISRFTDCVIVLTDGDASGRKAAGRIADVLIEQGLDPRIASLPEDHDPDSFLASEGPGELLGVIEGAQAYFRFARQIAGEAYESQEKALRRLLRPLTRVEDPLRLDFRLRELSDLFNVNKITIEKALHRLKSGTSGVRPPLGGAGAGLGTAAVGAELKSGGAEIPIREEPAPRRDLVLSLLRIGVEGGDLGRKAVASLREEWLGAGEMLEIYKFLDFASRNHIDISGEKLFRELEDQRLIRTASEIALHPLPPGELDLLIEDYSRTLALEATREERSRLQLLIDEAYQAGDLEKARQYQSQLYQIKERTSSKGR